MQRDEPKNLITTHAPEPMLYSMHRTLEEENTKNVRIPFKLLDCRHFFKFYETGEFFQVANPDERSLPKSMGRKTNILLFGPSSAGRAAFINSAVTAYSESKDVLSPMQIDEVQHTHFDPTSPFVLATAELGKNTLLTKIMGATWVDPTYDIKTILRAVLGELHAVPAYDEKTGKFLPNGNLPADLIVFTLPYTAIQRELDYMRILLERLTAYNIPCAILFTKTDLRAPAGGPYPAMAFRPPHGVKTFTVKSYNKNDKNSNEQMDNDILNTVVRMVMEAEVSLHKGLSALERKRQLYLIKKEKARQKKRIYSDDILIRIPEALTKVMESNYDCHALLEALILTDKLTPLGQLPPMPEILQSIFDEDTYEAQFNFKKGLTPLASLALKQIIRQKLSDELGGSLLPVIRAYIHIFQDEPRLLEILRTKQPLPFLTQIQMMSAMNVRYFCMKPWAINAKKELHTLSRQTLVDMVGNEFTGYRPGYFFDTLSPNMKRREPSIVNMAFIGPPRCDKSTLIRRLNQFAKGQGIVGKYSNRGEAIKATATRLSPFLQLLDVIELCGLEWTTRNLNSFVSILQSWFMGSDPDLPRIDLFVFVVPASATQEEITLVRALLHQFKYLGIPIGVAVTKLDEVKLIDDGNHETLKLLKPFTAENGQLVDTLPVRPIVYGKGVQSFAMLNEDDNVPDICSTVALRGLTHYILAAEMGLGVDVTATSFHKDAQSISDELDFLSSLREENEFQDCIDGEPESHPEQVSEPQSAPQLPRRREPFVADPVVAPPLPTQHVPQAPQPSIAQVTRNIVAGQRQSATRLVQASIAEVDEAREPLPSPDRQGLFARPTTRSENPGSVGDVTQPRPDARMPRTKGSQT